MKAAARLLPLYSMVSIAIAAAPAAAQPVGDWSESGYVNIRVRNEGVLQPREASGILENDMIDEILIGLTRTVSNSQSGSLEISGAGEQASPRDLGEILIDFGQLVVNAAVVDSISQVRVGTTSDTETRDPSAGTLTVRFSQFAIKVLLRNGIVTCENTTGMFVSAQGGRTVFSNCAGGVSTSINELSPLDPPVVSVDDSALTQFGPGGGTISVSSSTIDTFSASIRAGDITIGGDGQVFWDDEGTLSVRDPNSPGHELPPLNFLLSSGSTIETKATVIRADDVAIQGGSTWRSFDPMSMYATTFEIRSASIIDARSDLGVGGSVTIGSGVAEDSRIDVGRNLYLGPGTLTIEDGGFVDVAGTLTISPTGTLNLNGGTLRVGNLVQESGATLNENGGTLIVPEAGATASAIAVALSLAIARSRVRRR
jgi:hypothetical protein